MYKNYTIFKYVAHEVCECCALSPFSIGPVGFIVHFCIVQCFLETHTFHYKAELIDAQ